MFSATMPKQIEELAVEILNEPETITITKRERTNQDMGQKFYVVSERERDDALLKGPPFGLIRRNSQRPKVGH